jgi:hypothetical protein
MFLESVDDFQSRFSRMLRSCEPTVPYIAVSQSLAPVDIEGGALALPHDRRHVWDLLAQAAVERAVAHDY